jgi:predicted alpha/beta superfamily hydrolase
MTTLRKRTTRIAALLSFVLLSVASALCQIQATPLRATNTIDSKVMGEQRDITVVLPRGYDASNDRYPVLYVFDPDWTLNSTSAAAEVLYGVHLAPKCIVVGVSSADRERDFTPALVRSEKPPPEVKNFGKAEAFQRFLRVEVFAFVDAHYRTAKMRVFVGHSLGGLLALDLAVHHPSPSERILLVDPSLWWDDSYVLTLVRPVANANPTFLSNITMENSEHDQWWDDWESLQGAFPRNKRSYAAVIKGESHLSVFYPGVYQGLKQVFSDFTPRMTNDHTFSTLVALEQQYSELSAELGTEVAIPESALLRIARDNLYQGRFEIAQSAMDRAAQLYPQSAGVKDVRTELQNAKNDPKLMFHPLHASAVSAKEFAAWKGHWSGSYRVEPGDSVPVDVFFEARDGKLVGSSVAKGVAFNGGDLRDPLLNLRVEANGSIAWDRDNPSGGYYVSHASLVASGKITGREEVFSPRPPPPNMRMPKVTFLLTRVKE